MCVTHRQARSDERRRMKAIDSGTVQKKFECECFGGKNRYAGRRWWILLAKSCATTHGHAHVNKIETEWCVAPNWRLSRFVSSPQQKQQSLVGPIINLKRWNVNVPFRGYRLQRDPHSLEIEFNLCVTESTIRDNKLNRQRKYIFPSSDDKCFFPQHSTRGVVAEHYPRTTRLQLVATRRTVSTLQINHLTK